MQRLDDGINASESEYTLESEEEEVSEEDYFSEDEVGEKLENPESLVSSMNQRKQWIEKLNLDLDEFW